MLGVHIRRLHPEDAKNSGADHEDHDVEESLRNHTESKTPLNNVLHQIRRAEPIDWAADRRAARKRSQNWVAPALQQRGKELHVRHKRRNQNDRNIRRIKEIQRPADPMPPHPAKR